MTDTKKIPSDSGKTLTLSGVVGTKKPIGHLVRQSLQQGRSKTVTVEVKKNRSLISKETPSVQKFSSDQNQSNITSSSSPSPTSTQKETSSRSLTAGELETRRQALKGSLSKSQSNQDSHQTPSEKEEASSQAPLTKDSTILSQENSIEATGTNLPVKEADEKSSLVQDSSKKDSLSFRERSEISNSSTIHKGATKGSTLGNDDPFKKKIDKFAEIDDEDEGDSPKKNLKKKLSLAPKREKSSRLPSQEVYGYEPDDEIDEKSSVSYSLIGNRLRTTVPRRTRSTSRSKSFSSGKFSEKKEVQKVIREVTLPESITVQDLANRMAVRGAEVVKALIKAGMMVSINDAIDADTAELIIVEFGHTVKRVSDSDVELGLENTSSFNNYPLEPRPPVVTIMGHVDHGKTSLLDALRSTDVVSGEAGGITQHIGAYQVTLKSGKKITFIDTPGHAAFTEMRARGAHATDIVVLVVAADDGIKEQTVEALHHAQAAQVPIVVAINKCDKPGANPARVRTELLNHNIVPEEMGGEVLTIEVSAQQKTNLDKLEEAILLQAELLDLKASLKGKAQGVIIEAKLEKGKGPVATVLINNGTLHPGDIFVAGVHGGRARNMIDDHGRQITAAYPSMPVEVMGFDTVPHAGDKFHVVENEESSRSILDYRLQKAKEKKHLHSLRAPLDQLFEKIKEGTLQELAILIKADVQGSLEAIKNSLEKLSTNEVGVKIVHAGVGAIHESDVTLAKASNAFIIGFNVRANVQAREMAHKDHIEIRYYSIIYNVLDDVKKALGGLLSPDLKENFLGYAEIREVFNITKVGNIAGCMVTEGTVKRGAKVRLLRDNVVIHEGTLKTLRRFKDEVREVREGFECGMAFENYQDVRIGDRIECFEIEEIARSL